MTEEKKRYFIELEPDTSSPTRAAEDFSRRRLAHAFVANLYDWLQEREITEKVLNLDVTPLGLVHITCSSDVISHVRSQERTPIASIRHGSDFIEGMGRWAT
jgi:hypothetical protein